MCSLLTGFEQVFASIQAIARDHRLHHSLRTIIEGACGSVLAQILVFRLR